LRASLKNLKNAWDPHFKSLKQLEAGKLKPNQVVEPPQFKKKGQHDQLSLFTRRLAGAAP
jgi:hypothetical protein